MKKKFPWISLLYAGEVAVPNPLQGVNSFPQLLGNIANGIGVLIASIGTIMLIVAGILFLTSAGNVQRMDTAKKALTYAIIGIAIGIAAPAITDVILGIIQK